MKNTDWQKQRHEDRCLVALFSHIATILVVHFPEKFDIVVKTLWRKGSKRETEEAFVGRDIIDVF